ncbi:MAG: sulfite exporter TauE/SafE family protein [Thermomicrobiales bacterium]
MVRSNGFSPKKAWLTNLTIYTIGRIVSSVAVGATFGALGALTVHRMPADLRSTILIVLALVVVLRELGIINFQLPEVRRQTRSRWVYGRPVINRAMWALDVGAVYLTWQFFAGAYFLGAAVLFSGDL